METASTKPALSLSSLLEESKRLNSHLASAEIPAVSRGLPLLEAESRKLVARSARNAASASAGGGGGGAASLQLDPRAQSLLAGSGIDPDDIAAGSASAALLSAFEMLLPSYDAHVETFLAQQQELSIVNAIEESELSTLDDFDRCMTAHMQQVWEDAQKSLFDEIGQHQHQHPHSVDASVAASSASSVYFDLADDSASAKLTHPRVARYAAVVRSLNDARAAVAARSAPLQFDLLAALKTATSESSSELQSKQITQVWSLISQLASAPGSHVAGACKYLEDIFIEHVDRVVAQYPHDANVGGVPSVHRKIEGYLKVLFGRLGRVPAFLEVFNNDAIWAHMFMLYRCGYRAELLKYCLEMEDIISDSDPGFVAHLKAFIDGSPALRQSDLPVTAASLEDPYKAALYSVLGRSNVPRKAAAEVIQTTEDYLWSALVRIRDADTIASVSAARPLSSLDDLQELMLRYGPGHFDPNNTNPLLYLRVLLLCGLFEHAVDYLLQVDLFQIEAVHIAILLVHLRMLRMPDQAATDSVSVSAGYLVDDSSSSSSNSGGSGSGSGGKCRRAFDFSRMIAQYTAALPASAADDALCYLLLLTLPADSVAVDSPVAARQRASCEQAIVRTLYDGRNYAHFIGDIQPDGVRRKGFLERYLPLLGISTHEQFSQTIIRKLADRSRDEGRLADAVLLYNLGERYNTVLGVLCKQLGDLLYVYSTSGGSAIASVVETMGLEDIDGVARAVLTHYKQREHISRVLDSRAVDTCSTLLALMDFFSLHRRGAFEDALQVIEGTQLLPLSDVSESTATSVAAGQYAERVRSLDDSITRNFSLILLTAMDTLSRLYAGLKESPFLDAVKQASMIVLRKKARCLMVFAGMIQFRMPSDTYAKLNRMDVFMN
ncbi:nuclear pore complex subunit [Coemansia erecta]|uniref:Nuclear pore protein n=1 Tax=Coemansia erecta TaxID=147472 RepID=A0A9W7Y7N7_9FUNG|nr:nuclear pore complex subunit [Coemansia erecta]